MQKMNPSQSIKRMQSRKSHSWWWDSHISRKNSKWLAENLAVMDQSVKEMLKLIEEEGDSFAKKAEMYYERRPQLISHVEDFYRMYRALAERYDQVTGELRKNLKSELKSQSSGEGLDTVSETSSPTALQSSEVTPMSKSRHAMLTTRAAGFSFFLGSGGSSDASKKSSNDGSSSSSSSDSETEADDLSEINEDDDSAMLHQKIMELENELQEVKDKLKFHEDKSYHEHNGHLDNEKYPDLNTKISGLEEQLSDANKKIHDSEMEIVDLQKKIEESNATVEAMNANISLEQKKVSELEEQIVLLQNEISAYKQENEQLRSQSDDQIEHYKNELIVAKEKSLQENAILESKIADLEDINSVLNAKVDQYAKDNSSFEAHMTELELIINDLKASSASTMEKFIQEKSSLEAHVLVLSQSNASLEARVTALACQIQQLEDEKTAAADVHTNCITELNKNIDALKLKVKMVTAEKQELAAKLSSLLNDVKCYDDKISQMDLNLQKSQLDHVKLIAAHDAMKKSCSKLQLRVKELEEEIEKHKVAVSDSAEGKREAIRQLCFSLEHYRDGYHQLRQLLQGHKTSRIMAS